MEFEQEQTSKYQSPVDYLKLFFRRKWFLVWPTYAGLILGIAACFILPRTWESSAIILVEEEKIINPLIQNLAVSTSAGQRMESIRETILGWNSLVELTERLNLAKDIRDQAGYEALILNLRRNILVQMRSGNIIRIAYRGQKSPAETQLVAKNLMEILVQKNVQTQTKETDIAIKFITEQLAIYKRKIKEAEVSKLQDELKNLLLDSTEAHPIVKELRYRIKLAEEQLNSGEFEIKVGDVAINDATRQAMQDELDKLINNEVSQQATTSKVPYTEQQANDALYKVMLMDRLSSTMARDVDVNEKIYSMLLQKLETAKITQRLEASRAGTRYTIIDPPRLPLRPIKPNKAVVMLAGIFLGLGSGVGMIFLREFTDQSVLDIEDAKRSLDMTVLGAISKITTQEEMEKERAKIKVKVKLAGIVGAALIVVSLLIYLLMR